MSVEAIELVIESPTDADALVREAAARGDASAGYWAHVWPAAIAMSGVVARSPFIGAGTGVLEIGCGLGVVGLVAARRGAAVTLTDANEEAVAAAARNARLNGIDARCARFDWNDEPDAAWDHDVLIGCDVLYAEASAGAIGRLIDRLSCVALLGCPARAGSEGVGDRLREAGLRVWETSMAGGRLLVAQRAGA